MTHRDFSKASRARCLRRALYVGFVFAIPWCFVYSCTPRRDVTPSPAHVIPENWQPSLEQVQDELQGAFQRNPNKSQQTLNRASQTMADLVDARLFIAYVRLFGSLDPTSQSELFAEQKDWLAKRVDTAQASVSSKGGSLGSLEYSGTYRKITEERLAELEKRLAEQSKKQPAN